MKRVLFVLALISAFVYGSAFAQITVGGQLGVAYSGGNETAKKDGKTNEKKGDSPLTFVFSPYAIYSLTSDFGIGAQLGVGYSSWTSPANSTLDGHKDDKSVRSDLMFHFTPFARYTLLGNDRIRLFLDGQLPIRFGSEDNRKDIVGDKTTTTDGPSVFGIGVGIVPGLQVNLTSSFALIATANVASINFNYERASKTDSGVTQTKSNTDFSFGVNGAVPSKVPFMVGLAVSF